MTIISRDDSGIHNERAILSYSYDDSFSPPRITQLRLKNSSVGGVVVQPWVRVKLVMPKLSGIKSGHDMVEGTELITLYHVHNSGPVMVIDVLAKIGDIRMVGTRGRDQTIGYNVPFQAIWSTY